jgi:heat shock protein HspQ
MAKVIFQIDENGVIRDIGETYDAIPEGYIEVEAEYPSDIMGGYYKLVDGVVVKDDDLYEAYLAEQEAADEDGEYDDDGEEDE